MRDFLAKIFLRHRCRCIFVSPIIAEPGSLVILRTNSAGKLRKDDVATHLKNAHALAPGVGFLVLDGEWSIEVQAKGGQS